MPISGIYFKNHYCNDSFSIFQDILPPPKMAPAHTIKTLELTIGYNKSDATFGWKGFDNGLTLYYLRIEFN